MREQKSLVKWISCHNVTSSRQNPRQMVLSMSDTLSSQHTNNARRSSKSRVGMRSVSEPRHDAPTASPIRPERDRSLGWRSQSHAGSLMPSATHLPAAVLVALHLAEGRPSCNCENHRLSLHVGSHTTREEKPHAGFAPTSPSEPCTVLDAARSSVSIRHLLLGPKVRRPASHASCFGMQQAEPELIAHRKPK